MTDRPGPDSILAAPSQPSRRRARAWQAGLATLALAIVSACGGGGDGGVGTNGTGVSNGTVYGFGSVIVDGIRFDDRSARVEVEQGASGGTFVLTEAKLGQRTLVENNGSDDDASGTASRIEVEPSLIGTVESVTGSSFRLLGQTVNIIPTTSTQTATLLSGFSLGIAAGDVVEVHAIRRGTGAALVYDATRVEKKASTDHVRLTGIVTTSSGTTFKIGNVTIQRGSAVIRPAGATLADGKLVTVFAGSTAYTSGSNALTAQAVRVRTLASSSGTSDHFGGVIDSVSGSTIVIDGLTINLSGARFDPSNYAPASRDYVRVRGSFDASGNFIATRIQRRNGNDSTIDPAELIGTVSNAGASTTSFQVRDTLVTVPASGVTYSGVGCSAGVAVPDGTFVEVKGQIRSDGLVATKIQCGSEVQGGVVERRGFVANLDTSARTFDVVGVSGTIARVTYQANTFFRAIDAANATQWANGVAIEVEGALGSAAGVSPALITALKIKPENSSP
ncbi:DUF5666 domain-containing protein [Leptothrix sp. BB-4]